MARVAKPKVSRYQEWLATPPVECAILGVDPGASAGAALTIWSPVGHELVWAREVVTDTTALEVAVTDAVGAARAAQLALVVAIEEWGRGGPLGIDQWLGLGAAAGAWKRAALIAADVRAPTIVRSRAVVRVGQRTWRSAMIPEAGTRNAAGTFRPYDTEGWKKAAKARVLDLFGLRFGDVSADVAEAILIAHYATRDRRIADMIPRASALRNKG